MADPADALILRVSDNSTGYFGVYHQAGRSKPYRAQVRTGGKMVRLGRFATAEEAALCVAQSPQGQAAAAAAEAAAPPPPPLTAAEALQQARAERLTLRVAENQTGYLGVYHKSGRQGKPYRAEETGGGMKGHLGYFLTAEEAALCVARSLERRTAAVPPAPPPTRKELRQQAQAEGVTLRVAKNKTGYFGVYLVNPGQPKPYQAKMRRDGNKFLYFGSFATAEEAALCIARSPEGQAAAVPPAPPLTSEEVRQQARAEGLTLRVADNKAGYYGVYRLRKPEGRSKPYEAKLWRRGMVRHFGRFATAEEAALRIARLQAPPLVASEDNAGWAAGQEPQVPSDDGGDDGGEEDEEGEDECEVLDAVEVPDDEWTDDDTDVMSS